MSAEDGVVEQRHYTLDSLVNFLDPDSWDNVDKPTERMDGEPANAQSPK
jgi:hypothetical protein